MTTDLVDGLRETLVTDRVADSRTMTDEDGARERNVADALLQLARATDRVADAMFHFCEIYEISG